MLLRLLVAFLSVACVAKGVPAKIHDSPEGELDELIAEYYDVLAHERSFNSILNDLSRDQRQELDRILSKRPRISKEFKTALDKLAHLLAKELQVCSQIVFLIRLAKVAFVTSVYVQETQQETLKVNKAVFALEAQLAIKPIKGKKLSKTTLDVLKQIMVGAERRGDRIWPGC